jgi:FAD binding domain
MRTLPVLLNGPSGPPSAVSSGADALDVFATGPGNNMWWWRWDGSRWIGPVPLPGGQPNVPAEGVCAISSGPGRIEVFAAGAGNTPWWWRWNGTTWSLPVPLPAGANLFPVPVAAVSDGPNNLDIFATGVGNTAWWWRWNGAVWTPPIPLPPGADLPPERIAAVRANPGRLDVFAAGRTGNQLWRWFLAPGATWRLEPLRGSLPAQGVSAVSWGPNRIDVFGTSTKAGNPLLHWWSDGGAFFGPEELGGNLAPGAVSVVSSAPNRLDIFGISGDKHLVRWRWDGSNWSGPMVLGDNLPAGDVSAVTRGARIDLVVAGFGPSVQQWPGGRADNTTKQPWTNLAMNWQVPSVANFSPMAPAPPFGALAGHCYPESLEELVDIVKTAEGEGRRVRAVGSSWSNSDVAVTPDYLVETHKLNTELASVLGVPNVLAGPRGNLVHVEAGMKVGDLITLLDRRGLALPVLGGSSGQTIAGVISTSVHGANIKRGPIPDLVRAIHLVGPGGTQHWIEPSAGLTNRAALTQSLGIDPANVHQDDDWFNSALVAIGSFGIIYSVIVEAVPQFDLVETTKWLSWTDVRKRLVQGAPDSPFTSNRDVMVLLNPFRAPDGTRPCFLKTKTEEPAQAPLPQNGWDLLNEAWFLQGLELAVRGAWEVNPKGGGPLSMHEFVSAQTRGRTAEGVKRGRSYTITTSPGTPPLRGLSLEIAFDATNDNYLRFVDEADVLLDSAYVNENLGLGGWFSLRFVGQSKAYLSPQRRFARTCMVEIAALQEISHTRKLLARLEALGRQHGGIQHWGMFDDLRYEDVARAYPQLDTWLRVRRQLTNNGTVRTFDAPFVERCGLNNSGSPAILLRDPANGAVYVVYGAAKFHVPDPPTLNRLFPGVPIHDAQPGELEHIGVVPGDGTIFLEETTSNVYVIKGGAKTLIPNWNNATLSQMFPGYLLRRVWPNALSHIPDPRIPRLAPR